MRFGLRCIVWLAILYHAILSEQGGAEPARVAVVATDAARRGIAQGVDAYCRRDPGACLADAARLTSLLAASGPAAVEPRHRKRGALASSTP